ncbi:MAG: hypothetical protein V4724_14130 [Pseudomonadota bacterium]
MCIAPLACTCCLLSMLALPGMAQTHQQQLQQTTALPHTVHLARAVSDPLVDFASSLLREAYHRLGIDIVDDMPPGERALRALNAGDYFGDIVHMAGLELFYPNLVRVPVSHATIVPQLAEALQAMHKSGYIAERQAEFQRRMPHAQRAAAAALP